MVDCFYPTDKNYTVKLAKYIAKDYIELTQALFSCIQLPVALSTHPATAKVKKLKSCKLTYKYNTFYGTY